MMVPTPLILFGNNNPFPVAQLNLLNGDY